MKNLKPDRSITGLIPAIISLVVFFSSVAVLGFSAAFDILATVILLYALSLGFWAYFITHNPGYLITGLYMLSFSIILFVVEERDFGHGAASQEMKLALVWVLFFGIWTVFLLFTKRLKWRGREIMELSANDVQIAENTFTERPRPVGHVPYSKQEIIDFASFLRKRLIALPYFEDDRVLLVPVKMGQEYGHLFKFVGHRALENDSWVSISYTGEVTVNISKQDYLDFKEDFSFDHLCKNMGELFIGFFSVYTEQEEVRIMDKLNSAHVGYFS